MRTLLALVALALLALPARADDAAAAREHYKKGTRLYELNHFAEAAAEYELAYQAKDDPALLFNIGQAYRFDGQNRKALLAYKQYLRKLPSAPNRREVEAHITALEKLIDDEKRAASSPPTGTLAPVPETAPPTAPPPTSTTPALTARAPERPTPLYKKWWLWTAVGVGAAAVAVGLGVGLTHAGATEKTLPPIGGP